MAGVALAPAAHAQSIAANARCYVIPIPSLNAVNTQIQIPVSGEGWKPGDLIGVGVTQSGALNNQTQNAASTAAADGTFSTQLTLATVTAAPLIQPVTISATDENVFGSKAVTDKVIVATRAAATTGKAGLASQKTTWKVSGLPAGEIYAHFTHHGGAFATMRVGTSRGPCSVVKTRALPFPANAPGKYLSSFAVVVNRSKHYSPKTRPSVRAYDNVV